MVTIEAVITDPTESPRHNPSRVPLSEHMEGRIVEFRWSQSFVRNAKMRFETCDQQIENMATEEARILIRQNRDRLAAEGFPFATEADLRDI